MVCDTVIVNPCEKTYANAVSIAEEFALTASQLERSNSISWQSFMIITIFSIQIWDTINYTSVPILPMETSKTMTLIDQTTLVLAQFDLAVGIIISSQFIKTLFKRVSKKYWQS